ncbi:hypothetical protein LCI18_012775 [Fusarium solani-melongenae]|uniref:Uncharacterized protein n=1 Tax=Fusarium solani subsp. cucurbitae TaxID=2747967 RepID=A0ACD3ZKS2_FUSSC|nr:hypothetical protein LCI18_012775 [Fusarium solani-melongenae]
MSRIIAVAGASGRFGRVLLREILKKPDLRVRGLVRDKAKVPSYIRSSPALELIEGDAQDTAAIRQLVTGADTVVCAYFGDDTLMVESQKLLIDAAEEAGARRFFASDYTADYTKLDYGQLPSKDPMKKIHEYLQGKKIKGVHALIGAFIDTFWFSWFGVWNQKDLSLSFWGTGDEPWELTSYENAAEFVAELVVDTSATGFQKFVGDKKSIKQIAAVFEQVYGQKPKLHNLGTLTDLKARMEEISTAHPEDGQSWMPLLVRLVSNYFELYKLIISCLNYRFYQCYLTTGQFQVGSDGLSSYPGLEQRSVKEYLQSHSVESLATAMINLAQGRKDGPDAISLNISQYKLPLFKAHSAHDPKKHCTLHPQWLRVLIPEWSIDTEDAGRLHVAAAMLPHVPGRRIFGYAGQFNWDRILHILHKVDPKGQLPEDFSRVSTVLLSFLLITLTNSVKPSFTSTLEAVILSTETWMRRATVVQRFSMDNRSKATFGEGIAPAPASFVMPFSDTLSITSPRAGGEKGFLMDIGLTAWVSVSEIDADMLKIRGLYNPDDKNLSSRLGTGKRDLRRAKLRGRWAWRNSGSITMPIGIAESWARCLRFPMVDGRASWLESMIPKQQRVAVKIEDGAAGLVEIKLINTPQPGPDQILVKMTWTGVCGTDKSLLRDTWKAVGHAMSPETGGIAGHEGVGVVVAVSEEVRRRWSIGDRAGINGFSVPGTFQEYCVTDGRYASKIPDVVTDQEAAPILCGGVTAYEGLKKSGVKPGQWIAIPGAGGGLGHLAVQYARAMGMRVIGIDTGENKRQLVSKLGAKVFIDFKTIVHITTEIHKLTGNGAHGALVVAASKDAFAAAPTFLRPRGTIVAVGIPTDEAFVAGAAPALLTALQLRVVGSLLGDRKAVEEAFGLTARGLVRPVLTEGKLEDLNSWLEKLYAGQVAGRIVLRVAT